MTLLAYEQVTGRMARVRLLLWRILRHRLARVVCVLLIYAAVYGGLRFTRVLVHRHYDYYGVEAPDYPFGSSHMEVHDVGHGSYFDDHGGPANNRIDHVLRLAFYPLVKAEEWYWRWRSN